ncbi:MAG: phasin [Brevundimonas sp.]
MTKGDARRARKAAETVAATAAAQGEMLRAAGDVVAARLQILAAGMSDPRRADLPEMARMSLEKVEAGALAAAGASGKLSEAATRAGASALNEARLAGEAMSRAASARSPMDAGLALMSYGMGWWGRAAGEALKWNATLLEAQAEALKPIHRVATDNARRLRR